jgi:hypothetical protein
MDYFLYCLSNPNFTSNQRLFNYTEEIAPLKTNLFPKPAFFLVKIALCTSDQGLWLLKITESPPAVGAELLSQPPFDFARKNPVNPNGQSGTASGLHWQLSSASAFVIAITIIWLGRTKLKLPRAVVLVIESCWCDAGCRLAVL